MFQTDVVEKIKTRILYSVIFFPENLTVYEVMWINTVDPVIMEWDTKYAIGMLGN